jgi:hypothetical protein
MDALQKETNALDQNDELSYIGADTNNQSGDNYQKKDGKVDTYNREEGNVSNMTRNNIGDKEVEMDQKASRYIYEAEQEKIQGSTEIAAHGTIDMAAHGTTDMTI